METRTGLLVAHVVAAAVVVVFALPAARSGQLVPFVFRLLIAGLLLALGVLLYRVRGKQ